MNIGMGSWLMTKPPSRDDGMPHGPKMKAILIMTKQPDLSCSKVLVSELADEGKIKN